MTFRPLFPALLAAALLAGCGDKPRKQGQGVDGDIVTQLDEDVPEAGDRPAEASAPAVSAGRKPDAGTTRTLSAGPVPPRFRGEWRTERKYCGDPSDSMGLTVTAAQLLYYESEGKVRRAEMSAPGRLVVTADYTGEGESWTKQSTLRLTDAGALLLDGVTRIRCR